MVYFSLPRDNDTPHRMPNYEPFRYEISKVIWNGYLVDYFEATQYFNIPGVKFEVDIKRPEVIQCMRDNCGFYLKGNRRLLETVNGESFIHAKTSVLERDLMP